MLATEVSGELLTWWWTALAVGLAVAVVLVVLLQRLLDRVHQIEQGAAEVWRKGKDVARNTATTWMLGATAGTIEAIGEEAGRHAALLREKGV